MRISFFFLNKTFINYNLYFSKNIYVSFERFPDPEKSNNLKASKRTASLSVLPNLASNKPKNA